MKIPRLTKRRLAVLSIIVSAILSILHTSENGSVIQGEPDDTSFKTQDYLRK